MAARQRTARRSPGRRCGAHDAEVRLLHGECVAAMAGLMEAGIGAAGTDRSSGIDWQAETRDGRAVREAAARGEAKRLCHRWHLRPGTRPVPFGRADRASALADTAGLPGGRAARSVQRERRDVAFRWHFYCCRELSEIDPLSEGKSRAL